MSRIFYWAEPSSYEKTYKLLLGYLNVFIQLLIGSAAAFVQTSAILDLAENSLSLAQEHQAAVTDQLLNSRFHENTINLRAHLLHLEDVVHARQESLLAIQRRVSNVHGYGSSQWYAIGSPWFGVMAPQSMFDAISTYVNFEGEVAAPEKNAANLMMYIQQSTAAIRVKFHESVDFIFAGKDIGTDGKQNPEPHIYFVPYIRILTKLQAPRDSPNSSALAATSQSMIKPWLNGQVPRSKKTSLGRFSSRLSMGLSSPSRYGSLAHQTS